MKHEPFESVWNRQGAAYWLGGLIASIVALGLVAATRFADWAVLLMILLTGPFALLCAWVIYRLQRQRQQRRRD